jgi:geranyl-CoA carboxylase beta subunit
MAVIESTVSPGSEAFAANRAGMLALIDRVRTAEDIVHSTVRECREVIASLGSLL